MTPPNARAPALVLVLGTLLAGCATGPRGLPPTHGIQNFGQVNGQLFRGAQPDAAALDELQRLGVRTILNLRQTNDTWLAEPAEARARGIHYTNIPMRGLHAPTDDEMAAALDILATAPGPVFVHCKHGCDRTGTVIACYRLRHDGWTRDDAHAEAKRFGRSRWEFGMRRYVDEFPPITPWSTEVPPPGSNGTESQQRPSNAR